MKNVKRILFPFYKEKYHFLKEKWWFRLVIVIFIIIVILTPLVVFFESHYVNSDWCWRNIQEKTTVGEYANNGDFREQSNYCIQVTQNAAWESLVFSIAIFLFGLYILPLIFFKVIIDHIVFDSKNHI